LGKHERWFAGLDATTTLTDINLDQYAQRDMRDVSGEGEFFDIAGVVNGDHEVCVMGEGDKPGDFLRTDDLVSDEHVMDTAGDHNLRFAQFGAGNADRAGGKLFVRDDRRLMRFRMRTEFCRELLKCRRHFGDVPLQNVEVEQ
jgi:hypothetical protein